MHTINLADAKARLSALVGQVQAGEPVCILHHGKPVAQLTAVKAPRQRVDANVLRALTDSMPIQNQSAADFVRAMRDGDRY